MKRHMYFVMLRVQTRILLALLGALLVGPQGLRAQESPPEEGMPQPSSTPPQGIRLVERREGISVILRLPVADDVEKRMTALSLPERGIASAISGFTDEDISLTVKGGMVFMRLNRPVSGEMTLIGESETDYLFRLKPGDGDHAPDSYVKITRRESKPLDASGRSQRGSSNPKPSGSLAFLRAMRLGARPEGVRILRAHQDLIFRSKKVEIRLLYIFERSPYVGRVYELENLTSEPLVFDASQLRPSKRGSEALLLSGLRENLLRAGSKTHLYMAFWMKAR